MKNYIAVVRAIEIINGYFNLNIDPRGNVSEVFRLIEKYNTEDKLKNYLKVYALDKIQKL